VQVAGGSQRLDFELEPVALAELSGFIRDDSGAPVTNTGIGVLPIGGGILRQAVSDGAGFYRIPDLPNGEYQLTVQARDLGVLPSSRTVRIEGREVVPHDIQVTRGASVGGALLGFVSEEMGQVRIVASSGRESRIGRLISTGGSYLIEHLLPGRWVIGVETEAGHRSQGEVVVAEGDRDLTLDLELAEAKRTRESQN